MANWQHFAQSNHEDEANLTQSHTDAARCAEAIIDRVGRSVALAIPVGIGKPNLTVNALYRLAEADRRISLHIFTGLTLVRPHYGSELEQRFVDPLLRRLFGSWPDLAYAEAVRADRLPPNVQVTEFFLQAGQWLGSAAMQQAYVSLNYSHVAAQLQRMGINVLAQLVAPGPAGGGDRVSLASNTDTTLDLAPYVARRRAGGEPLAVVGELNANLPYMPGEAEVARSEFDLLLEPPAPHFELFAPPKEPVALADYAMALHVATLIKDGGTLQIGIGSFADALTHALTLRQLRNDAFRGLVEALGVPLHPEAQLGPFEQGLYGCSEILVDGFLALLRAGILKRHVVHEVEGQPARPALVHAGFFLGSRDFYRQLHEMPAAERASIVMTGIGFTNTLRGDAATKTAQRRDARFVNTAMTATLLGAVSSDQVEDGRVVSGIGGQADFVTMAHELPGARSVIALRSARSAGGGRRSSNIVWRYGNTSIPRHLRDIVVTEYGIADLRGASDADCIAAMLAISDSAYQASLEAEARRARKLGANAARPAWAAANTPARLEAALGSARASGLLPRFPHGTEMTDVEQGLITPLGRLRASSAFEVLGHLLRGFSAARDGERAGLERMGLDRPSSLKHRLMAALLRGAMR